MPPDLDQREWGILQERWIDLAEVVDYKEENDEIEEGSSTDDFKL